MATTVRDTQATLHGELCAALFFAFRVDLLATVRYTSPSTDSILGATIWMSAELIRAWTCLATVSNTKALRNSEFLTSFDSTFCMNLYSSVRDA